VRVLIIVGIACLVGAAVAAPAPAVDVIRPVRAFQVDPYRPEPDGPDVSRHTGLAVDAPTRDDVFLATDGGLLASHDGGRHWRLVSDRWLEALDFLSPRVGFALSGCGCPDRLLGTRDGGKTWIVVRRFPRFAGFDYGGAGVDFVDERHGWLWRSRLYHTGDGGLSWDVLPFRCARGEWFAGVTFNGERHGYATCSGADQSLSGELKVYESRDSGLSWRRLTLRTHTGVDARAAEHADLRDFDAMKSTRWSGWGVGLASSWPSRLRGYTLIQSLLFRTVDGGRSWRQIRPRSQPVSGSFTFLSPLRGLWVAPDRILATSDGGRTWWWRARRPRAIRAIATIPGGGLAGWGGVGQEPGTAAVQFSRSRDGGRTWELRGFLAGIHGLMVSIPSRRVWFGVGLQGQVFRSRDAGRSWIPVGGRTRLAVAQFFTPRVGYGVTKHPYGFKHPARLLRTTDGGDHWTEVHVDLGPQRHAILTNLAFADRRHGWISTLAGMLRTSDGGRTWVLLDGIGASEDESMAFATTRVGFIYGQDALWRTDDGGLHWRFIAGHVYPDAEF
jgi:photosystem II stability/assembly factor-like uncharacterized protein